MGDKIYKIVKDTVYKYKTSNPFEICEKMGLKIKFVNYGKAIIVNSELILINVKYDLGSKWILCAHELGHAILHKGDSLNHYDENNTLLKIEKDKEANLFAAYLLFNDDLDIKFANMNSYMLHNFIEGNLNFE